MEKFYAFFSAGLISTVLTWLVIKLYHRLGWVEDPKRDQQQKTTHQQPVPRGGGIPIFLTFLCCSLFLLTFDKYLLAVMIGALLLTIVGIVHDIHDIHPYWRIAAGLAAGLIVVGSGIGIAYISNPLGPEVIHLNQPQIAFYINNQLHTIWILADIFALIFILWNMNIVNWSKGVDGQLPAFVVIAFIFIGLLHSSFSSDPTEFNNTIMAFILAGAYVGLLIFNWYPQKIMPGYGGSSLAGYFLSILAIISGAKVATTLMLLAVPTADAVYTIIRRIGSGKSPIWGDRQHLHHQMLDFLGWGRRRISLFYAGITLLMGLLSLYLQTTGKIIVLVISFTFVFSLQIWAKISHQTNDQPTS